MLMPGGPDRALIVDDLAYTSREAPELVLPASHHVEAPPKHLMSNTLKDELGRCLGPNDVSSVPWDWSLTADPPLWSRSDLATNGQHKEHLGQL